MIPILFTFVACHTKVNSVLVRGCKQASTFLAHFSGKSRL
jgi:hypothetical protein